jgi:DNA invertase Pin-like site-specific DNA recombinase
MFMNKTLAYARVSSREQHLDRQIQQLMDFGIEDRDIIREHASGKDFNRPQYAVLRNGLLREGDTLVVTSLDRLSRNKADIKAELEYYKQKGIRVKILDLPTTVADLPEGQNWVFDMVNNVLLEVLASLAEQERRTIRQRQAEGIAAAHAKGKKFGRPSVRMPENFPEQLERVNRHEISARKLMQELGLKRSTYYRFVNDLRRK